MRHSLMHAEISDSFWVVLPGGFGGRRPVGSRNRIVWRRSPTPSTPIVLHAARLLDVRAGTVIQPGEVLVEGDRITAVGQSVDHPQGAKVIDLGDVTLMPGMIDAHVHLFLHPGAEDLQTVEESVPWRTILAEQAAKDDLMGGFTAERDMGTEGAGSASTAVRNAINRGHDSRAAHARLRQRHRHPGRP